ncbi:ChaN family lipoprotein [Oceanibacterium hippocampi]|uniref:Haem-binding uptake Tiki superfamily ChaN domain-containing protein n=1 Tax=Oceanibacterium hippocampi TaxID=745714 RepID=A0A1Y5U2A6_9PROT|nr:ChaN family lipoprotein [Oceanibacterium hippocampi]SLN76918.1 hypothetical protein OCH7691_04234 [Oceanibacterium hippocampi]
MTRSRFRALLAATVLALAASLAAPVAAVEWQETVEADHPLTGRILDVASGAEIPLEALYRRLDRTDILLLGEKHDNRDHHRLQALLIGAFAATGPAPAIAFEMIPGDRATALSPLPAAGDVDALARRLDWAKSGWPDWAIYRPVFEAALRASSDIRPANLERPRIRALYKEGWSALDPAFVERFALDAPLPAASAEALAATIVGAHCGMITADRAAPLVRVQRARDAVMAAALVDGGARRAVLIAGAGHVRKDWAVPQYLRRVAPDARVLAIAFREVPAPGESAQPERAPYDIVWYTPRVDTNDPCEAHREALGRMKAKQKGQAE